MPLSAQHDNLEHTDKSLFKRLQYAKEILVQMMSVASMPASLALPASSAPEMDEQPECEEANNYQSSRVPMIGVAVDTRMSVDQLQQSGRLTKSATKGAMMMSPYNSKNSAQAKDARTMRMQTLTASKMGAGTNLLSSNAKQSSKNKFELPMLSNRSNSKPALTQVRSTLKES